MPLGDLTRFAWRIKKQREEHRKELIQPFDSKYRVDRNFVRFYGFDVYEREFGLKRDVVMKGMFEGWNIEQMLKYQKRKYGE